MKKQYTAAERRALLDRIFNLFEKYEAEENKTDIADASLKSMEEEMKSLCDDYLSGIPDVNLSRCPFTGNLLKLPVDTLGLDGLWWNSDSPLRPASKLPDSFLGLDGALMLAGNPETAPFTAAPGPDRPFVIPRLLEYVQVKAVISTIKIGEHTAYPVAYFADPPLYGVEAVNEWGAGGYWAKDAPGLPGAWRSTVTMQEERDFNLAAWMKRGKVMWIAPEDQTMMLRSHLFQCPYLDLKGDDRPKFIENGVVRRIEESEPVPLEQFDAEKFLKLAAELEGGKK